MTSISSSNQKVVAITGITGCIGRKLAEYFALNQWKIIGFSSDPLVARKKLATLKGVSIFPFSLDSIDFLRNENVNVNVFIHLAWEGVSSGAKEDIAVQSKNLVISLLAAELAYICHAEKFLSLGSILEYAGVEGIIDESSIPSARSVYGICKVATRTALEQSLNNYGIPFLYAIVSSVYAVERDDGNVISYVIKCLRSGKSPRLSRCEHYWNFIHIDDLVHALYILSRTSNLKGVFVIGSAENFKLKDYIEEIHRQINPTVEIFYGDENVNTRTVHNGAVDISKMINATGFRPSIDFSAGISKILQNN